MNFNIWINRWIYVIWVNFNRYSKHPHIRTHDFRVQADLVLLFIECLVRNQPELVTSRLAGSVLVTINGSHCSRKDPLLLCPDKMILIRVCLILFYFFSPLIFYNCWSIFLLLLVKWQLWRKLELGALHTLIFYHYKSINTRERKKIKDVMPINYSKNPRIRT